MATKTPEFPMATRDLAFCRIAELTNAELYKDPESGVLRVERKYGDGTAIFFEGQRNGNGEVIRAAITNFNPQTKESLTDEVLLEDVRFRRYGAGGLDIVSKTAQGEIGVKIPLFELPRIYRPEENSVQS